MTSQSFTRPALLSACAYMLQAAGVSIAELAQHMGQQQPAARPGLPVREADIDAAHRGPAPAPFPGASLAALPAASGTNKPPAMMGAKTPHKPKPAPHQIVTFSPAEPAEGAKPKGEAIKTEKTVEILDTTVRPTAKWQTQQLPPDPRYPSFSSMPPGTDPRTGLAWGARP